MDYQRLVDCFVQIVREWTLDGENERNECFDPVIEELKNYFPAEKRGEVLVFVPGCGLARLPYQIALEGFQCVGNEQDPFLLITGSFIMNQCNRSNNYRFYPWIHDLSNRKSADEVTKPMAFPDINPSKRPENFQFNMNRWT